MKIYNELDAISSMDISAVKSLDEVNYYVDNSIIESVKKNLSDLSPKYDNGEIYSFISK